MKHRTSSQSGFTLIELLVSIAIFSVVAVGALGAMLKMSELNKRTQQTRRVMDNMSLAAESISRNLRLGKTYHCASTSAGPVLPAVATNLNAITVRDCATGGDFIAFYDQYYAGRLGEHASFYTLIKDSNGRGRVYYCSITDASCGGTYGVPMTSSEIDIQKLAFYTYYTSVTDKKQPRVTIVISGVTLVGNAAVPVEINVQTTVSQRALDI